MIVYIYAINPNSIKRSFCITHLSYKWHSGFLKTYHMVKKEFFWEGIKYDVQRFMVECLVFQQNKVEMVKTLGNLKPLDIPCQCWGGSLNRFYQRSTQARRE